MLKPQWWVDCSGMAKRATDAVRQGELKITPEEHKKTWFAWLDNIRDWCVSRQLWWGHRIPAYYVTYKGEVQEEPIVAGSEADAMQKALEKYECSASDLKLAQDEDVLDTWFSSGLFPFSPLGWPDEKHADLAAWHPTTLLETGKDILFFWVARMVMCSLQLTGKLPFTEVFLHAMVKDKYGRKMSKSLGNVIDPLEVINGVSLEHLQAKLQGGNLDPKELEKAMKNNESEYPQGIPECGSDALRFGLLAHTGKGKDINLDVNRVAGYSKFCNKLWNATRFAFFYIGGDGGASTFVPGSLPVSLSLTPSGGGGPRADVPSLADAWILSRLSETVDLMHQQLLDYEIAAASDTIYSFWYKELCDVYLESIKPVMQLDGSSIANAATKHATQTVLHAALHYGLRMLHPFMPFVTEELYMRLALLTGEERTTIMHASFPAPGSLSALRSAPAEQAMATLMNLAGTIRSLRANYLKGPLERHAPAIYLVCRHPAVAAVVRTQSETLCALARSSKSPPPASVELVPEGCVPPKGCATEVLDQHTEVHILLKGVVDLAKEVQRLNKEIGAINGRLEKLVKKMQAPDYASKCPAATQAEDAAKKDDMIAEMAVLGKAIKQFEAGQD